MMIKKRLLSMLVLLAAVATGARADQLASSYSSNATLNAVTVSASMEVTIATGVTVTINNGLNITSGTLTVKGPGTLVVNGKAGSNGSNGAQGGNGTPGSAAITGNIIVQGGATVKATGGNGGNGGASGPENGGHGANGAAAISGNVTIQDASTLEATGGNGGNGGYSEYETGGNGGNGGNAFAGTLTYKGGTVTADGGAGGSGGGGEEGGGSSGSAGKAFTTSVNFVSSDYILTDGSNAITATQVTSKKKVVISPKVAVNSVTLAPTSATLTLGETETVTLIPTVLPDDATDKTVTWSSSDEAVATVTDGVVTAVAAGTATITATATNGTADTSDDFSATCEVTVSPAGYSVALKESTEDATSWQGKAGTGDYQALPLTGLEAGTAVSVKYSGTKKVKSVKAKKKAADGTITAQLAAKLAYTGGEIADFTDATDDLTTMTWAKGEHIAILYEVSGTKKVADAEITAVDGTTGAATITFTVEEGTPDNTPCTLVYPYDAAKDDHTGVKDAATLLAAQNGTLSANLDVRVGEGTIQTTTPGLTVTNQPEAQFAIFKFTTQSVPSANGSLQNTNVTKLTVTIGAQDYVITPASATSTLYAALPAVSGQTVSFTATYGSNLYAASKASVSFDAAKYYQSTVKMGKVIEVFEDDDPILEDFTRNPSYKYLHIGLEQAYAIARQLSTQNTGATVAVVYNNENRDVTYALSSDASATARTLRGDHLFENNYRVFLATLWEDAD